MLLTNPIWLFALAAISIPVVIHLWNIRPGKTLKVGSIALFTESSPKSSRSLKLLDLLLLLLRCLMLILLAFLSAAPFWQQHLKAGKAKGWLMIPEVNLLQTYHHFQPQIDSLTKAGYELHFLRSDFKKQDLTELLKTYPDSMALQDTLNYWALSKQLSSKIPSSLPVALFTTNHISHFKGERPTTGLTINWHTYTPADSVSTWLAGAWLTSNGNIRVVQGTATPTGTTYQYNDIKNGGKAGSAYTVGVEHGEPVVSLNDSKISVDTTTQRIAIYTDKNMVDANYLKAALDAVSQLTQRKTLIKIYRQPEAIPTNQDWLFWLSEEAIDDDIISQTKNMLHYEDGKVFEAETWLSNKGNYNLIQGTAKIALHKNIESKNIGNAIWTDGFGNPVLSLDRDKTNTYHFYNRFNPAWSDLVWSDEFPKWIMDLVNNQQFNVGKHERRAISAEQLQPVHLNNNDAFVDIQTQQIELAHYLWLALALVFFSERWLATKNKTILVNG
ncbi:MAG: BatA domain-containing protein [Bacteroidota bacterium]